MQTTRCHQCPDTEVRSKTAFIQDSAGCAKAEATKALPAAHEHGLGENLGSKVRGIKFRFWALNLKLNSLESRLGIEGSRVKGA